MADSVDENFLQRLLAQNEKFTTDQITKLHGHVQNLRKSHKEELAEMRREMENSKEDNRKELSELSERVKRIEEDIETERQRKCSCQENVFQAFKLATAELERKCESGYIPADHHSMDQHCSDIGAEITIGDSSNLAEQSLQSIVPPISMFFPSTSSTPSAPKKRKITDAPSVTHFEQLDTDWQAKLQPFMRKSTMATAELLSDVQRAFVKFKADNLFVKQNHALTTSLVTQVIQDGLGLGIWVEGWTPSETNDLHAYLKDKLKYEKKHAAKSAMLEERAKRFASFELPTMEDVLITLGKDQENITI